MSRLVGVFKGSNGSMGFINGNIYNFRTSIDNGFIRLQTDIGLYCYYVNVESLLDNWVITNLDSHNDGLSQDEIKFWNEDDEEKN